MHLGGSRHGALFTGAASGKQPAASAPQGLPLFGMGGGGHGVRMRQTLSHASTSTASNSDTVDLDGEDDDDNEESDEIALALVRSKPYTLFFVKKTIFDCVLVISK